MKQKRNSSIDPNENLALGLTAITGFDGFGGQTASQGKKDGNASETVADKQEDLKLDSGETVNLDNASDTEHTRESESAKVESEERTETKGRTDKDKRDASKQQSPQDKPRLEHFSFVCDAGIIAKIRAIARKEHLTIREVMEYPLDWFIHQYEARHGEVRLSGQARKKSVKDIL